MYTNKRKRPYSQLIVPPPASKSRRTRKVFVTKSAERKASPVDYSTCAYTKSGINAILDQNNLTWIKSDNRSVSIPVFYPQTQLTLTEIKSPGEFNTRLQTGQPIIFGQNNEIVLTDSLSSGVDGVVFQGYFAGIKYKVVIKIPFLPIAHYSAAIGCAPSTSGIEQDNFDEVFREYEMMSTLKCGRGEGPIVCALGVAAIVLGGKVYAALALEFMDMSSVKYINMIHRTEGPNSAAKQATLVILKAFANIKTLHSMGIMHMDAHAENWLVKYKSLPPMQVDVRMVDLGRSCSFNIPGSIDDCKTMAEKSDADSLYKDYKFYGLIEFIQFSGFVYELFSMVMKKLPQQVRPMIMILRNLYQKYVDSYFEREMMLLPPQIAAMPFEYFIEESKLTTVLNILAKSPTIFTPQETSYLIAQGLVPQ